jgi:PHP family Zn ribbon phosphoesterase
VAYRALLDRFGTEMKVLRETSPEELAAVIGDRLAARLGAARSGTGRLEITPGAGGRYGRVRPPT